MNEMSNNQNDDALVTANEAAAFYGCSRRQIHRNVQRGLKKVVFGPRNVRYRIRDLKNFAERHTVEG